MRNNFIDCYPIWIALIYLIQPEDAAKVTPPKVVRRKKLPINRPYLMLLHDFGEPDSAEEEEDKAEEDAQ